jgi:tetratricopeptide (TPR) repeat protein
VLIEIRIDEAGVATYHRLIRGHPMLINAAVNAVKLWRYRPFVAAGKAVTAITLVIVPVGMPSPNSRDTINEMHFQHTYWTASEAADTAMANQDYPAAGKFLQESGTLLTADKGWVHISERARWQTAMGELSAATNQPVQAEQHYLQSIALYKQADKEGPEFAASLLNLGDFYSKTQRPELARDYLGQSTAVYRRSYKRVGSEYPDAQRAIGQAIASQSSVLARMAAERKDAAEVKKHCQTVGEFRKFVSSEDQTSLQSVCTNQP